MSKLSHQPKLGLCMQSANTIHLVYIMSHTILFYISLVLYYLSLFVENNKCMNLFNDCRCSNILHEYLNSARKITAVSVFRRYHLLNVSATNQCTSSVFNVTVKDRG